MLFAGYCAGFEGWRWRMVQAVAPIGDAPPWVDHIDIGTDDYWWKRGPDDARAWLRGLMKEHGSEDAARAAAWAAVEAAPWERKTLSNHRHGWDEASPWATKLGWNWNHELRQGEHLPHGDLIRLKGASRYTDGRTSARFVIGAGPSGVSYDDAEAALRWFARRNAASA